MPRYNGILRDLKGSVYDGGIHVPCLIRWPGKIEPGTKLDAVAAHIDITPTLIEACGAERPGNVSFDGVSLLGLLLGKAKSLDERLLFFQWHRGDEPELFRACAVRGPRYKLVQAAGRAEQNNYKQDWALYDMANDPAERQNVISEQPEMAARMKKAYESWFADVSATRGYPVPRVVVGTRHENPVTLTRQDWRGPRAGWRNDGLGHWEVDVATTGRFDVTVRMPAAKDARAVRLTMGAAERASDWPAGSDRVTFKDIELPAGRARVEGIVGEDPKTAGVHYVDILAHEPADD
jgi:arylsulfatase A-like enzyme